MESVSDESAETFHSDAAELKWFVAAVRAGLEGRPQQMQQFLRRSLRRLPPGVRNDKALAEALRQIAVQVASPVEGSAQDRARSLSTLSRPARLDTYFHGYEPDESNWVDPTSPGTVDQPWLTAVHQGFPFQPAQPIDIPIAVHLDELPAALTIDTAPPERPSLNPETTQAVSTLVDCHRNDLTEWGVVAASKVLLTGPPGTGKTMTARWIAHRLGLPLLVLNLAAVMSHELGRSAKNLSEAIQYASAFRCVLLIDEFDAIASARTDSRDVGEVRRLVNVLLMALDQWASTSLLIGATNHPELLDRAIERRFHEHLNLDPPQTDARRQIWSTQLPALSSDQLHVLALMSEGMTGSSIARVAQRARRSAALARREPNFGEILAALTTTHPRDKHLDRETRDDLIRALDQHTDLTHRAIADLVGVSHTTVNTVAGPSRHSGSPPKKALKKTAAKPSGSQLDTTKKPTSRAKTVPKSTVRKTAQTGRTTTQATKTPTVTRATRSLRSK